MIAPQPPSLQVFVPIERMSRADVPLEHFSSIATIQANDIIVMHGSPHRYSRCQNFLCLNGLPKVTQGVMNCGDQVVDRLAISGRRLFPDHAQARDVSLAAQPPTDKQLRAIRRGAKETALLGLALDQWFAASGTSICDR
jgi:hypothetical protein